MSKKLIYLVLFVLLLCVGFSSDVRAELVGYWKFDEASGTIAADSAGGDNDGTLIGDDLIWMAGRSAGALSFPGVPDDARVEFPTTGMSPTAGTVAMWGYLYDPQPETDGRYFFGHTAVGAWADRVQIYMQELTTPSRLLDIGLGSTHAHDIDIMEMPMEEWLHVALTWDSGNYAVYVNGEEVSSGTYAGLSTIQPIANIGNDGSGSPYEAFCGLLDEVQLYNNALSPVEVLSAMQGQPFPLASGPTPKDGSMILDTWANLSWRAGEFAVSHDVYFGDNFDNVNDGSESTFVGNQAGTFIVVGFPGFAYPDGLVPGTTYYWRIDEVNEAEPNSPWKGDLWSFSIAPRTAYYPDPADGAESVSVDMKLSWTAGFGAKLHTVYFGDNFDDVNNATGGSPQGTTTYTPGPLEMAKTYYWRVDEFDIIETYKGQVWSFTTEGAVGSPNPANGAVDVKQTPILTWTPGVFAASHQVYFGADEEAVRNATTGSPEYKGIKALDSETFDPGILEPDSTYYWRIDEVNDANPDSPWTGNIWSFTTASFLVVDDFEDYDAGENQIWYAWKDGLGYGVPGSDPYYAGNGSGSAVGDESSPSYTEETIVHEGNQAMPLFYDNNKQGFFKYSEAELTLTYPRDWTENGVNTLTIWFRGDSANAAEPLYVAINGSAVVANDNPDAAQVIAWMEWNIDLQAFADQGVNLANVNTIALGLGNKKNPLAGGSGTMYFDDIRLYPPAP